VIEITEALIWPDSGLQLITGYQFAWTFQQNFQHLERLLLELDLAP
jgi:hypothetical protein